MFHRLVKKNTSFLPAVCLVPAQGPQHLVIFIWLLVPQFDLQGANVCTRHVVPESHAVGRVLWVNHGAQQSGNFPFLAFVSLRINEIAISYCDRRTVLGIATSFFFFLCIPKKPQPPLIILFSFHTDGSSLTTERVRRRWFGSSRKAEVLYGEFIFSGSLLCCSLGCFVLRVNHNNMFTT